MHIETRPYALQLYEHASTIHARTQQLPWEPDTPIRLEISIVYASVVLRKLWEHYADIYREVKFDLRAPLPGLVLVGNEESPQEKLTLLHRVIHSQRIDTSYATLDHGVELHSDQRGTFLLDYPSLVSFFDEAAHATHKING